MKDIIKNTLVAVAAIAVAAGALFFLNGYSFLTSVLTYLLKVFLAMYFFAVLISVQQGEDNILNKTIRVVSAVLCPFLLFLELLYEPVARYVFGVMIQQAFFLSDLLAFALFLMFFFLFGLAAMLLNSFARGGFLSDWESYNNPKAFAIMRFFWPAAAAIALQLYIYNPFLVISVTR